MLDQRFRPPNFVRSVTPENPTVLYEAKVMEMTRHFIYRDGDLKPVEIERAIALALTNPNLKRIEAGRQDIKALEQFLLGISEHEAANGHEYAWQAELARQKNPERLTRDEVAELYANFKRKKPLEFAEKLAIKQYEAFLAVSPDGLIHVSDKISLERSDIEVLIIDIKARIAERNPDAQERRTTLEELDDELAGIISRIPKEQHGKRLELEEIYLLRRLIHNADTGHLASVSHGTPREDLRSDRGVDIVLMTAGDVYEFQVKTFKSGTHREAKETQAEVRARAERNLQGTNTRLVELQTEAVEETYGKSLRQASGTRHTLADKFAALEPITHDLLIKERARLLKLIGLTEEELANERFEFEKRQQGRREHEEELRTKRAEAAEAEARVEAKRQADIEAKLAGPKRHEEHIRAAQEEANERRRREAEEALLKEQRLAAERTAKDEAREEEAKGLAKADAKRQEEEIKKMEKNWVKTKLEQLGKPSALIELGFLETEDRNTLVAILAAKKLLAAKYPNAKSVLKEFPFEK